MADKIISVADIIIISIMIQKKTGEFPGNTILKIRTIILHGFENRTRAGNVPLKMPPIVP